MAKVGLIVQTVAAEEYMVCIDPVGFLKPPPKTLWELWFFHILRLSFLLDQKGISEVNANDPS